MIKKLMKDYEGSHIAVVFDAKGKTFRDDLYSEYKANRARMPDDLREQIAPIQQAGSVKGRGVWSSGLSVQGFGERAYVQLLDVSSTYLEGVQATALATVRAIAESDIAAGRRAAVANAGMAIWLAAYGAGLMECRPADDVPQFRTR